MPTFKRAVKTRVTAAQRQHATDMVSPPPEAPTPPKKAQGVKRLWADDSIGHYIVCITNGNGESSLYHMQKHSKVVYTLAKLAKCQQTVYTVVIGRAGQEVLHTCGCEGFMHRGQCKHVDAVLALRHAGKA